MLVIINDANLALSSFLSTTLSSSSTYSPPSQDFADAAEKLSTNFPIYF